MQSLSDIEVNNFKSSECYRVLAEYVQMYESGGDDVSQNVAMEDKIFSTLTEHSYMYDQVVNVKQVGTTPFNRGYEGLSWSRAHTRTHSIFNSGTSEAALAPNAVILEDNPFTKDFALYTEQVCASDPHYAKYSAADVKYGALGSTHATHGFACVDDEVPCEIAKISEDGKMNKAYMFQKDPVLKKFVIVGVPYKIVKWVVHAALPRISDIISAALNTVQQVSEGAGM